MFARIDFSKLTLMDALDLASLIEVEAFQRYMLFAAQLGHRDPSDAGSVFRSMADNEKKHGEQLAKRRQALYGDAPAIVKLDDIFDVEAPDVGSPRWNMSPRKAFEVALAAEQKAFAFYDQALPSVKEPAVRILFEELRDEEAEHIHMVEAIIAKLPPEAATELEDLDAE
jgi:rubrerythrin